MGPVAKGTVIGTEANHGPVYYGNTPITLEMQKGGDRRGSHRHYQKRPLIKGPYIRGGTYLNAYGYYRDAQGNYYQVYMPGNGYNGCSDWMAPLFPRSLFIGLSGYDVYLLQKALVLEGFGSFTPTGYFGTATFASVMKYQSHYGMTPVGSVGPLTRGQLNKTYFQLPQ
jgi:peptidoglycan hydrolase-like protein with peptidoglycan-binding domain